jgi:excisionase family DNA binding protein
MPSLLFVADSTPRDKRDGTKEKNMRPLKNVVQTAELCGISPWTVRSYIKQGKLRPIRIGRRVLIAEAEIERFVAANQISEAVSEVANDNQ